MAIKPLLILTLSLLWLGCSLAISAEEKRKVILIAGQDSHGHGAHEFLAGCTLLKKKLEEAMGDQMEVVMVRGGWPEDPSVFEGAAATVIYSDGLGRHPLNKHFKTMDRLVSQGMGVAMMHFACDVQPGEKGDAFKKWIGGHYETKYSTNPHWVCRSLLDAKHEICSGCKGFELKDEWYFNMRWSESLKHTPILQGVPDKAARSGKTSSPRGAMSHIVEAEGRKETLLWAVERPDGGRGFGFTGGHYHANWKNDEFRKLILNAITWLAKIDVPKEGVITKTPTDEEMHFDTKLERRQRKQEAAKSSKHYLFAYFKGNGEDGLHLAYSLDGLKWKSLNRDKSWLQPKVGSELMRDPSICKGPDGMFHMVWTTGWWDTGIGVAHSKDLIHWSEQKALGVMKHEAKAKNCWAPEIFYDAASRQYYIFWATTIPGKFPETEQKGGDHNHRIYYVTTSDFKTYSKSALLYDGGFNVIDASVMQVGRRYLMFIKDETLKPKVEKNIRYLMADRMEGPWSEMSDVISPAWVEGPTSIKIGDHYYLYYDAYKRKRFEGVKSKDLKTWTPITESLKMPKGIRHGTVFEVSNKVAQPLLKLGE